MRDFVMTIIQSIARGFGFEIGRDAAKGVEHFVEDRFEGR